MSSPRKQESIGCGAIFELWGDHLGLNSVCFNVREAKTARQRRHQSSHIARNRPTAVQAQESGGAAPLRPRLQAQRFHRKTLHCVWSTGDPAVVAALRHPFAPVDAVESPLC